MEILSVNIAVPRNIEIAGRMVSTGIYKTPVQGPQRIEGYGLVGDLRVEPRRFGDANHAVYLYPHEHYAFWQRSLGCEPFPYGQFGENLTATGLVESRVRVGDILRCGTSVLQITQPRIPCRKLNVRMGRRFAGIFLRSRRVGYYLRVLETGTVAAGDSIEIIESDPRSPTLDDFVRISQLDYWDAEGLESLLRAKDLADAWRSTIEEKIQRARTADGWLGLRQMEVERRVEECEGVASFYLRCPHGRALASFRAGQYVTVALRPSPVSNEVRRSYAISSSPLDRSVYRITVQLKPPGAAVPEGLVSSILHRDVGTGDRIRIGAPRGTFTLDAVPRDCTGLVFIAGGIGAAPVVSMLHHWAQMLDGVPACLVYAAANARVQPLREEVLRIAAERPALRVRFAYSDPPPADRLGPDYQIRGPLSRDDLAPLLPGPQGRIFLAGPSAFVDATRETLASLGACEGQVRAEKFGS
jgi:MOSC domain-containing protein YiiM/ferredoxin-NADP reductase